MQAIGKAIRQQRDRARMSQSALARKAKVGRVTLNRIEMGTQQPELATLDRIAKALKIPLRELVGG
jgi:transcriptional regulator with XRE-family HTH domain